MAPARATSSMRRQGRRSGSFPRLAHAARPRLMAAAMAACVRIVEIARGCKRDGRARQRQLVVEVDGRHRRHLVRRDAAQARSAPSARSRPIRLPATCQGAPGPAALDGRRSRRTRGPSSGRPMMSWRCTTSGLSVTGPSGSPSAGAYTSATQRRGQQLRIGLSSAASSPGVGSCSRIRRMRWCSAAVVIHRVVQAFPRHLLVRTPIGGPASACSRRDS